MDSDEFDDEGLADEDLLNAESQAPARTESTQPPVTCTKTRPAVASIQNSFNLRQTNPPSTKPSTIINLDDLPSDAFSSSLDSNRGQATRPGQRLGGPVPVYRQTTLFGGAVQSNGQSSQNQRINSNRVFRADMPPEAPTHHEIDREAMNTWVYPTNLGPIRDYQYSIVKSGLFNNTLVALPTGLGKTFIAATVMLNFFRWTKTAKIIFVAPTKPLVTQQVDACFGVVGIPRSQTTLLTGEIAPALRADEWATKRVFFMTPQTLENDLSSGFADPKSIGLLVVDEAHRATGNYAYVKVVNFIRRFSNSFRILALTATPGSKVEAVQEVIDSLGISHVEIRTEESLDLRAYVHQRDENVQVLDPSEEMTEIKDLFSKALKPVVNRLSQQNIYYGRDPMSLTTYGLMKSRKCWLAGAGRHANQGVKFMMMAVFSILQSLAHSIKLLNFHGMKPFYDNMVQFRDETGDKGEKGSKNKRQIIESPDFQKMMSILGDWVGKEDFISHPKLTSLCDTVLNHFMDAGEGKDGVDTSNTRIIVFSEYRDSAEEIVRVLNRHKPMIRAAVFVGQADTRKSEGMKQSEQIERIKRFKQGDFNVLVATSIGEEGLDIGQVDLIICYDSSASPIRMLQRMGRTGRKRAGRVVLLLMRGKEADNYAKSKDGYEKMQQMICDGSRFEFRYNLSTRIVPRDIQPEVDKRHVDIPIENTQITSLPEPKKGRATKKKPAKKFHMPDGVETGFTSVAAMLGKRPKAAAQRPVTSEPTEAHDVAEIPSLDKVFLTREQDDELRRHYQNLPFYQDHVEEIVPVDLSKFPAEQRVLRKTVLLNHGRHTKRCVKLFRKLATSQSNLERYHKPFGISDQSNYDQLPLPNDMSESELDTTNVAPPPSKKRKTISFSDNSEVEEIPAVQAKVAKPKARQTRGPKKTAAQKTKPTSRQHTINLVEDDEEEVDHSGQRGRPLAPRKSNKKTPQVKRSKASKKRPSHIYDESADEGDDCRRTSDLDPTDDSDEGSDLVDFVVDDNMATSSMRRSTSPTSAPASSLLDRRPATKRKPYRETTPLSPTQDNDDDDDDDDDDNDDDDDIPSLDQIFGRGKTKRASKKGVFSESDDEDVGVQKRPDRAGKRRVVSDDDDSDD